MNKEIDISQMVSGLTEIYQPIFKHPELSTAVSRKSEDRLKHIQDVCFSLQNKLGRPLRILDLGCAQGFFSLSLCEMGATVVGLDYLEENITLCRSLAQENGFSTATFLHGRIESFIDAVTDETFDVVLGLSVFHHIAYEFGFERVQELFRKIYSISKVLIAELALATEPLYWAPSQPEDVETLLQDAKFFIHLGKFSTHLSGIERPLFFASNNFWYAGNNLERFVDCKVCPHVYAGGVYQGTRKYYFSNENVLKIFRVDGAFQDLNIQELNDEIEFLLNVPKGFEAAKLISHGETDVFKWVVQEKIQGSLLLDMILNGEQFQDDILIEDILNQLVILEKNGLYCKDLRVWNIIVNEDEGKNYIIDYGSITKNKRDCVWPYNLFLSFLIFVKEIKDKKNLESFPSRTVAISASRMPESYQAWAYELFKKPIEDWSFEFLLNEMRKFRGQAPHSKKQSKGMFCWNNAIEVLIDEHVQIIRNLHDGVMKVQEDMNKSNDNTEVALKAITSLEEVLVKQINNQQQHIVHIEQLLNEEKAKNCELFKDNNTLEERLLNETEALEKRLVNETAILEEKMLSDIQVIQSEKSELEETLSVMASELDKSREQMNFLELTKEELEDELQEVIRARDNNAVALTNTSIALENTHAALLQREKELAEIQHIQAEYIKVQQELMGVYASKSWIVTKPLRLIVKTIKALLGMFKQFVKECLKSSIQVGLKIPFLKQMFKRIIGKNSRTFKWLRTFAIRNNVIEEPCSEQAVNEIKQIKEKEVAEFVYCNTESSSNISDIEFFKYNDDPTYFVFVDHTITCPVNSGVQRVVRGIGAQLLEQGKKVVFVKWDYLKQSCVRINWQERNYLSEWNGPSIKETDEEFYSTLNGETVVIENIKVGDWLIVGEVPHITPHPTPITLKLLVWARKMELKTGFVFYDATPLRRDELHNMVPAHTEYMKHLIAADAIWPISEWSGKDLETFFIKGELCTLETLPEIKVIPLTGQVDGCEYLADEVEKIILSVGSVDTHKNQLKLLQAFEQFIIENPDSDWRLVLVGSINPKLEPEVNKIAKKCNSIEVAGCVSEDVLQSYYKKAAFTVFPSVAEGFGLPILESLWYGKPCVCANFGAMLEVGEGGGCHLIDTREILDIKDALIQLTSDPSKLEKLSVEARNRKLLSWTEYVGDIVEHIKEINNPARNVGYVYFWLDHTVQNNFNTGIQRVTRQIARSLIKLGMKLIPVEFDLRNHTFKPVSTKRLENAANWNGPEVSAWTKWVEPTALRQNDWFFMPELVSGMMEEHKQTLDSFVKRKGLKRAFIFYDAIPLKMRNIYPPQVFEAHKRYMLNSSEYDLILPISETSRVDYLSYVGAWLDRPNGLDQKVRACVLPGEFPESERVTEINKVVSDRITILSVGTVEPRKNHETLLRAIQIVSTRCNKGIKLVIAGGENLLDPALPGKMDALVAAMPIVSWVKDADDAHLHQLMQDCDFTVYPSLEEGFGMPILESLWNGKPCICSSKSAMGEISRGGGCLGVDVSNPDSLANAIQSLIEDDELRMQLTEEAVNRPLKLWQDYGAEIAMYMDAETPKKKKVSFDVTLNDMEKRSLDMRIGKRPKLSVCVSTYNRDEWLAACLENWQRLYPKPIDGVEFFVCDNTSTDNTPDVVKPFLERPDFRYSRNSENVGMLGNLRETAFKAEGEYIWILGDDDLMIPGVIEHILEALDQHNDLSMVYLNYAYSREENAKSITDFNAFINDSTPVIPPEADIYGSVREIAGRNGNVFTAIYTLVTRRDHALHMFAQNMAGRPFSSMLTCIPTTNYVLNNMMDEKGYWLGEPQVVVNLNVSWMDYAPLWILERIQDAFDLAEKKGVPAAQMDKWRMETTGGVVQYFKEILSNDEIGNLSYFDAGRLIRRFKHIPGFKEFYPEIRHHYNHHYHTGNPHTRLPTEVIFQEGY
ncbi:glycosyltransferase [Gelidibacter japonicus]|uniref:glycosyltransferase n=1 Tax=Gelidibacter japonicus TaxID=1962232 RepID=UPI003A94391B